MGLSKLKEPFAAKDIKWLPGKVYDGSALALAYVDARAIENRLDEVCRPENWQTEFSEVNGGIFCKLSIRVNNEWISKMDGAPVTTFEPFKGGISDALKRVAASGWGIGRYLYQLEGKWVKYDSARKKLAETPQLPAWALPKGDKKDRKEMGESSLSRSFDSDIQLADSLEVLKEVGANIKSALGNGEINGDDKDKLMIAYKDRQKQLE